MIPSTIQKNVVALLLCGAFSGCSPQESADAPCTRVKLEHVGDIEIVDRYMKTPLWGGRGPYGSALAIYVDMQALGAESNFSRPVKVTIFPSEKSSVQKNKELDSQCAVLAVEGGKRVACNVALMNMPVFVRIIFEEKPAEGSGMEIYGARAVSIAQKLQEEAFMCTSSKKWVGVP